MAGAGFTLLAVLSLLALKPKGFVYGAGSATATRWMDLPDGNNWNIPYVAEELGEKATVAMRQAIDDVHAHTCIRFILKTDERYFVRFVNGSGEGCFAQIGRRTDIPNTIIIGEKCDRGNILHEMMHTFGFYHEHTRPDRDEYINVVTDNVIPYHIYNFFKLRENDVVSFGSKYDVGSIMHFPASAFTANGKDTITSASGEPLSGLQQGKLSSSDIEQINAMYECDINPKSAVKARIAAACVNKSQKCAWFAARGKCITRAAWMAENCKKACDYCDIFIHCKDIEDFQCEETREKCQTSSRIRRKCPKTCGLC